MALVSRSTLFEDVAREDIEALTALGRHLDYEPGALLFQRGDRADGLHVIVRGEVRIVRAAELRRDRTLISGSYLAASAGEDTAIEVASNGSHNGHVVHPDLMEILSMRVPAEIKRALEQRAEREGRPAGAIALELLEEVKK